MCTCKQLNKKMYITKNLGCPSKLGVKLGTPAQDDTIPTTVSLMGSKRAKPKYLFKKIRYTMKCSSQTASGRPCALEGSPVFTQKYDFISVSTFANGNGKNCQFSLLLPENLGSLRRIHGCDITQSLSSLLLPLFSSYIYYINI